MNKTYELVAGSGTINLTLPTTAAVGDTVGLLGTGTATWHLVPNANQVITTTSLSGNTAPGASWTPRLAPRMWHWLASSADGRVLAAGDIPGNLWVSNDGGANWSADNSLGGQNWISIDMTPAGDKLIAVAYGGGLFIGTNSGTAVNWTQVTSTSPGVTLASQPFESVTMSPDGQRITAVVQNGPIYVSADGGAHWATGTLAGGSTPLTDWWRAVDSSADGMVQVVASHNGRVYVSSDGGLSWVNRDVAAGGAPVAAEWYRLAMSADGNTIALAARFNGNMFISRNRGVSWTQASTPVGDYTQVQMTPDAQVIAATITNGDGNPTIGSVQLSRNGGASFSAMAMPGGDTNWRGVALSSDGNQFAVAAGTFTTTNGQLYTSLGNRTSVGALGFIEGAQNQSVEVEYLGNSRWNVRASSAGAFSVKSARRWLVR